IVEAGQKPEQGALARAACSNESNELSRQHASAYLAENLRAAGMTEADIVQLQGSLACRKRLAVAALRGSRALVEHVKDQRGPIQAGLDVDTKAGDFGQRAPQPVQVGNEDHDVAHGEAAATGRIEKLVPIDEVAPVAEDDSATERKDGLNGERIPGLQLVDVAP